MEDLVNKIINNIKEIDDIQVLFENQKFNIPYSDGKLTIIHKTNIYEFNVELKKHFRIINLNQLEDSKKDYQNLIIFSDYITPPLRDELKNKGVYYADAMGNLFLKSNSFFFFINGKRNVNAVSITRNKSFSSAGLRLIYNLLINEQIINKTYRDISKITKLSLDTISHVFKELEIQGFIVNINQDNKKIIRKKELFEKWVSFYGEVLKPKITRGRYKFLDKNMLVSWDKLNLDFQKTLWGGEPAANLLTHYLRPEFFTIYSGENNGELLKNYNLIPDLNGNIDVINKFWYDEILDIHKQNNNYYHYDFINHNYNNTTVEPILIYADLIYSNNPRNIETAKIIYQEYIERFISQN
ncbi:MAG TPA: type IV toxin-antitoxin system AbiEi family antitoxin [Ignavibacteria bacterium]